MKQPDPDPAPRDEMTEDQAEHILAEALEDYHRTKARGERPDEASFRDRLGDLHEEFIELVAAETLIDRAIEPAADDSHLPAAWGAYTLLEEIARGAAGVVYRAIHRKLGRTVALKVLRTGVDTDKNARERFHREAQALAHVKHDNIVEIYEFGELDGRPYYAMSLVEGPSLMQLEKMGKRPSPAELCRGLAGVADALVTLHAQGIIHRDVKPQNIIVGEDGRYMLADFGLARSAMAETMTQSGDALGTPLYMSPEQMLGDRKAIEERTDIYGLGATMYQLLTGTPPFKTDNLHALMRMILKERPADPRTVNPDVPRACASIALKCLEKESRDRYETAEALRGDLLAFADGQRVAGKPLGRPTRGIRRLRRHPVLAAAAMILVAVGVWWYLQPADPASFTLATNVGAEASINNGEWLSTPWAKRELASNRTYRVEIHPNDSDYLNRTLEFEATPGGDIVREIILEPKDGVNNPEALDALRKGAGVEAADPEPAELHRGFEPFFVAVQFPRGKARLEDLDRYEVALGEKTRVKRKERAFGDGNIEWFLNGTRVASTPLVAPSMLPRSDLSFPIPATVRDAVKPGDTLRWGYRFRDEDDLHDETTVSVVASDPKLTARIGKARTLVAENWVSNPQQRQLAQAILEAELLLEAGLPYPAVRAVHKNFDREFEAAQKVMDGRAAELQAANEAESRARKRVAELEASGRPSDAAAGKAYDEALEAARADEDAKAAAIEALLEPRLRVLSAPTSLRSLSLLSLQQLALEQLWPSNSLLKDSFWWARHQAWRGMFSQDEWKAFYNR